MFLQWIPEVRRHCPGIPYLLVGTKTEKRDDPKKPEKLEKLAKIGLTPVTPEEGIAAAQKNGAYAYKECSAKLMVSDYYRHIASNNPMVVVC